MVLTNPFFIPNFEKQLKKEVKMSEEKNDTMEFIRYCKREKSAFVKEYWEEEQNVIKKRVCAENLLIAFDQLIDRLLKISKTDVL